MSAPGLRRIYSFLVFVLLVCSELTLPQPPPPTLRILVLAILPRLRLLPHRHFRTSSHSTAPYVGNTLLRITGNQLPQLLDTQLLPPSTLCRLLCTCLQRVYDRAVSWQCDRLRSCLLRVDESHMRHSCQLPHILQCRIRNAPIEWLTAHEYGSLGQVHTKLL